MENTEQRLRTELERTTISLSAARSAFDDAESRISKLEIKVETMEGMNHRLCMERNSYRQKADSLSKEISKICRHGLDIKQIEHLVEERAKMQKQIQDLHNEKRYANAEMERVRADYDELLESHAASRLREASPQPAIGTESAEHRSELERVISNLTEYVNAKEMQLETVKQVNRSLVQEVEALTEQLKQGSR